MASDLIEITPAVSNDGSAPALSELLAELVSRSGVHGWQVRRGPFWCYADPGGPRPPAQGWKWHVSATPRSAADVLTRAAEVLLRHGCPFKFVPTLQQVVDINAAGADRSRSGKFLTAYPGNDEHFRVVADDLHQA